jgi:hypothetical protein
VIKKKGKKKKRKRKKRKKKKKRLRNPGENTFLYFQFCLLYGLVNGWAHPLHHTQNNAKKI